MGWCIRLEMGIQLGVEQDLVIGLPSISTAASRRTSPTVSVPVLSEQSTSMLPKFSIAASRFTMTLASAIRFAP